MRTGKLSISRGYRFGDVAAPAPRLVLVPKSDDAPKPKPGRGPAAPAVPVSAEYQPAHDRLAALERLARLRKQGILTAEELAAEKALILNRTAGERVAHEAATIDEAEPPRPVSARGPSLLGRLFGWRFLPLGMAAGVGLSFATQPQETIRFFDETLRLLGA